MEWKPIEHAYFISDMNDLILWNGVRVFVGWLDVDGWHDSTNQDRNDFAEDPQPTHFMRFPDPPKE